MSASFVQLPSEILIDPNISALDLRIYAICMDFGRKSQGFSQIGHHHLGKLVGKHPKTIAKSIKRLTELGYITVQKIGLNRNDRLRCKKTVKREKSDGTPTIRQEGTPDVAPTLVDKSTKKRYKDRSNILLSNPLKEIPKTFPITTPDAVRSTTTTQAIEEHQDLTRELRNNLKGSICPAAYSRWFQNIIVLDNKSDELTISVQKSAFNTDFIKTNYSEILNSIAKKKVNIFSNIVAWSYGQFHNIG